MHSTQHDQPDWRRLTAALKRCLITAISWLWQLLWSMATPRPTWRWTTVIAWWELRRLVLNAALGVSYAMSILALGIVATLYDDNYFPEPIAVVVWAVLLGFFCNVCYTAGWIVELLLMWHWPRVAARLAPISFGVGCAVLLLIPWLLPAGAAIHQGGCESGLTVDAVPGTYVADRGEPYSYTLRIRDDGNYAETWVMRSGDTYTNAGTWQFVPESPNPRVGLESAMFDPFRTSLQPDAGSYRFNPDHRTTWRLRLHRCWGATKLRLHDSDEVFSLVKTD
jgi:hypothetical protein